MKKYLLLFPVLLLVLMSSCNCNKNPNDGDDIDDINPILEVEKVIITDDFCVKTIYSPVYIITFPPSISLSPGAGT